MSTKLDSFDASKLGAFIQSKLDARNGVSAPQPYTLVISPVTTEPRTYAMTDQNGIYGQHVSEVLNSSLVYGREGSGLAAQSMVRRRRMVGFAIPNTAQVLNATGAEIRLTVAVVDSPLEPLFVSLYFRNATTTPLITPAYNGAWWDFFQPRGFNIGVSQAQLTGEGPTNHTFALDVALVKARVNQTLYVIMGTRAEMSGVGLGDPYVRSRFTVSSMGLYLIG